MKPVTLFFVKLTHQAGLMAVFAVLSELSMFSVEIFDEIFLLLYFILENNSSRMCVLPKSDDTNKA